MVQHKPTDQYLLTSKVSTTHETFYKKKKKKKKKKHLSHADDNANSGVTAIALPVPSYRRAKKEGLEGNKIRERTSIYT